MKSKLILVALFATLALASCHKSTVVRGVIYNGRIINSICGQITIQFTDSTDLGQNGWLDQSTTYNHVFRVENPCNWNPDGVGVTTSGPIRFFLTTPTYQNCAQCLAIGHTPETAYSIQLVR